MAYALYDRLLRAVKASGLPYTVVGGAASRGRGTMRSIETITLHHTATPRSYARSQDYPTMNVVKNGRPGLPGPLAQLGLGRSGRVYLIAAGIANHAGRSRATSMTNPHAIGIEAEGANEAWPKAQYDAYVRLVRALLDEFDLPTSRALRHAETCSPAGRKVDASFNGDSFRKAVAQRPTKPTAPTKPTQKKGLLGMTHSDRRWTTMRQMIQPKQRRAITLGNKLQICPTEKGQTTLLDVKTEIVGIDRPHEVQGRIVLVSYDNGKRNVVHSFPDVNLPHLGSFSQLHTCESDRKRLEYQLEVRNPFGGDGQHITLHSAHVEVLQS